MRGLRGRTGRWPARSTSFDHDAAVALSLRAERHLADGRPGDALADLDEAAALHGRARRVRRGAWERLLAHVGRRRADALFRLDRLEQALAVADDAVTRLHALAGVHARSEEGYLLAVRLRAVLLWRLGRREDAVDEAERALRTVRALGDRHDPTPWLRLLCEWLCHLDRQDEGAPYGEEAVRRLRADRAAPATLADVLVSVGTCLLSVRPADSLAASDEVISLLEPLLDGHSGLHEDAVLVARRNRARAVHALALGEENVLGPYPLCADCRAVNDGLVATRHRQVHVAANGRESCVDERLAAIMPTLWAVCATTSSCQGDSHAYVTPADGQADAAEAVLTDLGFAVERHDGDLRFRLDDRPA